jgi:hypothetical protein
MDMAQTINFYAIQSEKIFADKEAARLAKEEQIRLENERIEQERIMQEKALKAKLERERERERLEEETRANAEAMKKKIAENKKKKEVALAAAAALKKTEVSEKKIEKENTGKVRTKPKIQLRKHSPCHDSRERFDTVYCKLFSGKLNFREASSNVRFAKAGE